jgi:5-methylcytosine-specific restriction endonuclease McrA
MSFRSNYAAYLASDHWQEKREEMLAKCGYRCSVCSSSEFLNVHHNSYQNLGNEKDSDLVVLCRDCHALFHDKLATGDYNEPNDDDERRERVVSDYFSMLEEGQEY